ncbi:hypothetical protein SKP52_19870 [Sphingopyxis fribergensis]|uniref:Uncharacterized protein n=1 Tax=Sphingopyxis fribergensis TaxID=1515612 RepID=A0A0A7PLG1_9SPHN|nr:MULTISPECIES: hypothetical protein [Sphingomonadales]AJA10840.1 hypothetical protein SKP52_19870 [Sphingopyxis fribergensis]
MSKRSKRDTQGARSKFPRPDKLATLHIDTDNERFVFTTKDMIQNQLRRDGPKIRRSFDLAAKDDIAACSAVFGLAAGLCFRHCLPSAPMAQIRGCDLRRIWASS